MRISLSSLLAKCPVTILALVTTASLTLDAAPPAGWKMVFNDEFDGVELNRAKWGTTMEFIGTHGQRYHNEYYASYTVDDEIVVHGGQLQLRTDRRNIEGPEKPHIWEYTQGLISSHDHFTFTHGYVEIRAKFPGGRGLWPCLWLMPQSQGWPPEFDIAEYYAGQKTMHHGLAYGGLYNSAWDSLWDRTTDFESDFHTYALEWMPGRAVWTMDGVVRKTITAEYVPNVPMYLILSNSVSSISGPSGEPDEETVFPNAFLIDYVRVYQPAPPVETVLVKNEATPAPEAVVLPPAALIFPAPVP